MARTFPKVASRLGAAVVLPLALWLVTDPPEPLRPFRPWLIGAVILLSTVTVWWFTSWEVRNEEPPRAPDAQLTRNRRLLLQRVRNDWIDGFLKPFMDRATRIESTLRLKSRPVPRTPPPLLEPVVSPTALGPSLVPVFDQAMGQLLVFGAPGSGKSTLLLELCRELLDRAQRDDLLPIPVYFNLASWGVRRPPLGEWLVEQLNLGYGVHRTIAQELVHTQSILPLLDALDEVRPEHRAACVRAINAYRTNHPLAVCSRGEEYDALHTKLQDMTTVEVTPLEIGKIEAWLGNPDGPHVRLREAVKTDQALKDLLDTPLMLSIAERAWAGMDQAKVGTAEEWRARLFFSYVRQMLLRRSDVRGWNRTKTVRWLRWLAQDLNRRSHAEFYVDDLLPPSLPRPLPFLFRVAPITSATLILLAAMSWLDALIVAIAILGGLRFGLPTWTKPVDALRWSYAGLKWGVPTLLLAGVVAGVAIAVDFDLVRWAAFPLTFIVAAGLSAALWNHLASPQKQPRLGQRRGRAIVALARTLMTGVAGALMSVAALAGLGGLLGAGLGLSGGLGGGVIGILLGLGMGALLGLFGFVVALSAALSLEAKEIAIRSRVDERTRQSLRSFVKLTLFVAVAFFLVLVGCVQLMLLLFDESLNALIVEGSLTASVFVVGAALVALLFGLLIGIRNGGGFYIQHHVVLLLLWLTGQAPWNYVTFLEYCTELQLLRRAGSGYVFPHALLLQWFAALTDHGIHALCAHPATTSEQFDGAGVQGAH